MEVNRFQSVLEDAHGQDTVQMNAFAQHPHEHGRDAELQQDDDQRTNGVQRARVRIGAKTARSVATGPRRNILDRHLDTERKAREVNGHGWKKRRTCKWPVERAFE